MLVYLRVILPPPKEPHRGGEHGIQVDDGDDLLMRERTLRHLGLPLVVVCRLTDFHWVYYSSLHLFSH